MAAVANAMPERSDAHTYSLRGTPLRRFRSLWRHMRRLEREGHLSAPRQLWELAWLKVLRDIGPALYMIAGLSRRGLTWKQKLTYVGGRRYDRIIHRINPAEYDHFARNKLESYAIFVEHGIPTPPVYGIVDGADTAAWTGPVLRTPDDVVELTRRIDTDTLCFKYITGTRGRGFYKVRVAGDGPSSSVTILPGGETRPLGEFLRMLREDTLFQGYFCQGVIDQHPAVARLNPHCVNTSRTWMVRTASGPWRMPIAVLRIAFGESAVDNLSRGGFGVGIDIGTGCLRKAFTQGVDRTPYTHHPLTGEALEGFQIPMWRDAVALCRRTAALFHHNNLVTVDVAFGREGPLVVEVGTTPDDMQGQVDCGVYPLLDQLSKKGRVDDAVWDWADDVGD